MVLRRQCVDLLLFIWSCWLSHVSAFIVPAAQAWRMCPTATTTAATFTTTTMMFGYWRSNSSEKIATANTQVETKHKNNYKSTSNKRERVVTTKEITRMEREVHSTVMGKEVEDVLTSSREWKLGDVQMYSLIVGACIGYAVGLALVHWLDRNLEVIVPFGTAAFGVSLALDVRKGLRSMTELAKAGIELGVKKGINEEDSTFIREVVPRLERKAKQNNMLLTQMLLSFDENVEEEEESLLGSFAGMEGQIALTSRLLEQLQNKNLEKKTVKELKALIKGKAAFQLPSSSSSSKKSVSTSGTKAHLIATIKELDSASIASY